jgi:HPt (histidine-containing phosphotransfer) domain-containing protein
MSASQIPTLLDEPVLASLHEDFASTGDLDELATLIHNFVDRSAGRVAEMAAALERGDAERIRTAGHQLKGSSSTLGAGLLGAVAGNVESAGASGDLPSVTRAVRELEVVFSLTRGALTDLAEAIGGEWCARCSPTTSRSPWPCCARPSSGWATTAPS